MNERAARSTWTRVALITAGIVIAGGFVATRIDNGRATGPTAAPAIPWDAVNWIRQEPGALNAAGTSVLSDARRSATGIVASGEFSQPNRAAPDGQAFQGVIWTSTDGVAWEGLLTPGDGLTSLAVLTAAAGDGGILAIAQHPGAIRPSVILSADRRSWVEVLMPEALDSAPILAADGAEFIAASVQDGRPVAWSTPDGRAWRREVVPAPPGVVSLTAIEETPAGVFMTGWVEDDRDWDAMIWHRKAGTWVRLGAAAPALAEPDRGEAVTKVVPFEHGLLAVGWAGELEACQLVGGRRLAALGPVIADHCPGLPPALWASADGVSWVEAAGPRPAGLAPGAEVYLADIAAGGDGVLALAYEPDPAQADSRLAVWTSADGASWWRIANGMERGDAYPQAPFVFPNRLVVLGGTDAGRLVVWLGDPVDLP